MNFEYPETLAPTIASFLLVLGVLILVFCRANHDLIAFSIASIALALVVFNPSKSSYQMAGLAIWPGYYLFSRLQYKRGKIQLSYLWHFLVLVVWGLLSNAVPKEMQGGIFEGLYLLQFLIYLGLSLAEINKTARSIKSDNYFRAGYLRTLFIGLISLLIIRFILPVMIYEAANAMNIFHWFVGLYFIVVSGFFITQPIQIAHHIVDDAQVHELANYEEEMKRKLNRVMTKDKVYLNPELTLNELSELLEVKLPELSGFINNNLGKNFNDFVNDYRVVEFKKLVRSADTDPRATVMELAYKAGFNSKASFNRIFKESTGLTPTQYKREVVNLS